MKTKIISIAFCLAATTAFADEACTNLSSFVGIKYRLDSKTCELNGAFGETFTVEPYERSTFAGYNLISGSISIGPSTSVNSVDKCTMAAGTVQVETCAFDSSCRPLGWTYTITKNTVEFVANGCVAKYSANHN